MWLHSVRLLGLTRDGPCLNSAIPLVADGIRSLRRFRGQVSFKGQIAFKGQISSTRMHNSSSWAGFMKRQCQLLMCVPTLLTACAQGPRDAIPQQDSAVVLSDTAIPRDVQGSSSMGATTKNQNGVGSSFQQQWIPGQPDEGYYENRSRFSARAHNFSNGRLLLWLDTSITRNQQTTPRFNLVVADSAVVSSLAASEVFTPYCRVGSGLADGQIGGVAPILVPEKWERPRLAWRFDTVTSRIRLIPTDSVSCAVLGPD